MAIYLDYAAATPVDPTVMAAMQPFFSEHFYNPSALYGPAVETANALNAARSTVADALGAKTSEIIFTAGGTEANNLAIHGVMHKYPKGEIALSSIEHDSVRGPASQYKTIIISSDANGVVDPAEVTLKVTDDTVLISIMYANNEVGSVQPIRRISAQLDVIRKQRLKNNNQLPLYFHVDAAQAGNYLDMHVHRLGVDLMTINGGKLYGPKQSGALYVKTGTELHPLILGGGQERNLRSGTENVAGTIGFATALRKSIELRQAEVQRLKDLQVDFINNLQIAFPELIINGSLKYRLPNNVHATIPGTDNERVLMALDMENIYAAAGSACSASHDEPSHVLKALGYDDEHIRSSLRFSLGRQTTADDLTRTVATLKRILA